MIRIWGAVALVAAAFVMLPLAGARAQAPRNPIAAANVRQSERYDAVLRENPAFRAKRIAKECGPINDPRLHAECVASFDSGAEAPAPGR